MGEATRKKKAERDRLAYKRAAAQAQADKDAAVAHESALTEAWQRFVNLRFPLYHGGNR